MKAHPVDEKFREPSVLSNDDRPKDFGSENLQTGEAGLSEESNRLTTGEGDDPLQDLEREGRFEGYDFGSRMSVGREGVDERKVGKDCSRFGDLQGGSTREEKGPFSEVSEALPSFCRTNLAPSPSLPSIELNGRSLEHLDLGLIPFLSPESLRSNLVVEGGEKGEGLGGDSSETFLLSFGLCELVLKRGDLLLVRGGKIRRGRSGHCVGLGRETDREEGDGCRRKMSSRFET